MPNQRLPATILLIAVAAIWGLAGPVIVHTLQFIPPFTFLFLRFLIATPLLLPLLIGNLDIQQMRFKDWRRLAALTFLGITFSIGLIFVGFQYTTALDGSLISILGPMLIVAGGAAFLKEQITKREKIGLALALAGSLVIIVQPLLEYGLSFGKRAALGNILIFMSAAAWAAYALWDKRWQTAFSPLTVTATGALVGTLFFAPLAVVELTTSPAVRPVNLPAALPGVIYMSLFSYIAAYFLYEWAVRRIEVSEAAVFGYLQPVFAFPAAFILLGELPTPSLFLGATLIAIGVFLTEYKN